MTQPTDRPAEHCGHQPDPVIGQPTECVLRPGHSGSHADHTGMRWWMRAQPTDRPGIDQVDALHEQLDELRLIARMKDGMHRSAEGDITALTATLTAVRALHERDPEADYCVVCSNHGDITWPCATVAVLDQHGQTPA